MTILKLYGGKNLTNLILPAPDEYKEAPRPANYILDNLSDPPKYFCEKYTKTIIYFNKSEVQQQFYYWMSQPAVMADHALWSQWMCILKWLYKKKWHPTGCGFYFLGEFVWKP